MLLLYQIHILKTHSSSAQYLTLPVIFIYLTREEVSLPFMHWHTASPVNTNLNPHTARRNKIIYLHCNLMIVLQCKTYRFYIPSAFVTKLTYSWISYCLRCIYVMKGVFSFFFFIFFFLLLLFCYIVITLLFKYKKHNMAHWKDRKGREDALWV